MAKTDQAARMRSSCCRNTSGQPYRGTHIYARINEYHWTMRSHNGAYSDQLLDNHVIPDSRKSDVRERLIMSFRKKTPHLLCAALKTHFVYVVLCY